MSASATSQQLTRILKRHSYSDTAIGPIAAIVGPEKSQMISEMVGYAQAVVAAGGVGADVESHSAYCSLFNELCGFPAEARAAMKSMLSNGSTVADIADTYGWAPKRVAAFLNGDARAYHLP